MTKKAARVEQIVKSYDLTKIMSKDLETQDDEINDIILDCLSYEKVEPFTRKWDKLYEHYEQIVYQIIKRELEKEQNGYDKA